MKTENAWKKYADKKPVFDFCEGYKEFMSLCKTERECTDEIIKQAKKAGFKNLDTVIEKGETYGPYFSVFPLGEEVFGFSIKGAKYPLTNHTLIPYDSLCVSNQFQEDEVTISFLNGIVILMETKDR